MGKNPEYVSPFADQPPSDPENALRARNAFARLINHFNIFSSETMTPEKRIEVSRRLYRTVEVYYSFSVKAAAEGVREEDRGEFIKNGLKAEALIDQSDPIRADEEYTIVSEGYKLNRRYWDERLGRVRRLRNELRDMR